MDDACKPRYGSAINRIYTRSGASKRGRRVPSASLVSVPLPHRVFSSLNVRAPRESLYKKKKGKVFLHSAHDFPGQMYRQAPVRAFFG